MLVPVRAGIAKALYGSGFVGGGAKGYHASIRGNIVVSLR